MTNPHGVKSRPSVWWPRSRFYNGSFGRLFRNLPPYEPPGKNDQDKETFLRDLAIKMVEDNTGPAFDNDAIPAGYTYFGQFVDHDITFDPTSSLQRQNDPEGLQNFRSPRFDMDNVYGRGPDNSPFMYDQLEPGKLLVGKLKQENPERHAALIPDAQEDDLPRNDQGVAIIGDPRNDENTMVSQLQLGLIKFHNAVVDHLTSTTALGGDALFHEAQRLVRWHYQWVVIHDYLKRIAGVDLVDSLLPDKSRCAHKPRLCFYDYKHDPFMPVEFSVAAYRFGHSMVRPAYQLNQQIGAAPNLPIFDAAESRLSLKHFGGFRPLPQFWTIQWDLFLEINGSNPQKSRLIDTRLAQPLVQLPASINKAMSPLAFLNLARGWRMGLPSGQRVARAMCVDPLPPDLEDSEDPLWRYILREAETVAGGRQLGPVGGRIVAEVFIGLLAGDPLSYLNIDPCWQPEFDSMGDNFELRDILHFAGVA
jgi:hypothetical protein